MAVIVDGGRGTGGEVVQNAVINDLSPQIDGVTDTFVLSDDQLLLHLFHNGVRQFDNYLKTGTSLVLSFVPELGDVLTAILGTDPPLMFGTAAFEDTSAFDAAGNAAARVAKIGDTMTGSLIIDASTPTIISSDDVAGALPALRVAQSGTRNTLARWATLEIHNPNDGDDVETTRYAGSATLQLRAGATRNLPRYIHFARWTGDGINNWIWGVNSSNVALMYSSDDLVHRLWMEPASETGHSSIAAAGTGAIKLNHHPNDATGTGGLDVHMGGTGGTANKRLLRVRKATPGDNASDTIVSINSEPGSDLLFRFDEAENARWTLKYDTGDNELSIYSDVAAKKIMALSDSGRVYFGAGSTPFHLVNILDDTDPVLHISSMTANLALAAAIDLMESPTAFGTAGAYGFRIMLNGTTNLFSIQSGSTTTVTDRLTITRDTGLVGINTNAATEQLDINGNGIRIRTDRTPASAGAAGNAGTIVWDAGYIYVCTATNTWKRAELLTW
jgi:hypothetical protein